MKNIAYIISNIDKSIAFEWIIESTICENFNLHFILINPGPSKLQEYCKQKSIPCKTIIYKGKKNLLPATIRTRKTLIKWKIDLIHCHLFEAGLIGLTAGRLSGIKNRIYTRHHSSLHHVYFPKAIKYDKFINKSANKIISISSEVSRILIEKEKVEKDKIIEIHHGFKFEEIESVKQKDIDAIKAKYNLIANQPILGVISRYIEWKGIQFIIPAFERILKEFPSAKLVLANAKGPYKTEIKKLLSALPKENYIEIDFEENIFALYKAFDVFIHTPIDEHSEAFGQTYIEALASEIPSVFTKSGVGNDILIDKFNCLLSNHKNSESTYHNIRVILSDKALAKKITANGKTLVYQEFQFKKMIDQLCSLYNSN